MNENATTIQKLLQELQSGDWYDRKMAALELGRRKDPRATEPLLHALSREEDDDACAAMIWALGELGDRKAAPALRHIARCHEDTMLRESAARALARLVDPESIEIFIEQVSRSYNPEVREAAARVLGQLRVERAASQLVGLLNDEDKRVRHAAVEALLQMDETVVLQEIGKYMERELFLSRSIPHVVDLLEQYSSKEAVAFLAALLQKTDPYSSWLSQDQALRGRIARALGRVIGRTDQPEWLLQNREIVCCTYAASIVDGILEELGRQAISRRMWRLLMLMRNHPEVRQHKVRQKIDAVLSAELER